LVNKIITNMKGVDGDDGKENLNIKKRWWTQEED
jgi:hypothetical protein